MKRSAQLFVLSMVMVSCVMVAYGKAHITNSEIIAEIQDRLYHARIPKHGAVNVQFDNGVATLTGSVDSIGVKNDAERATQKVDDVQSVVNQITVNSDDTSVDQMLMAARKEIVTYPFFTIFDNVVIQVQGDHMTVSGQVTQPYKKSDIGSYLSHVKGVAELTNNLQVLPTSPVDDSLRLAVARAIYNDPYFVNYANQAVPPIHIIVDNQNVTLEGVVNSQIDKQRAEMDARFAGTYLSLTNNLQVETGRKKPA